MFWQELSRNQIYSYVATEARNEKTQITCAEPNQLVYNLLPSKGIQGDNNMCVMARTINQPNVFIWGLQGNQVICGYPNQQYHTSTKGYVVTRTFNLQDVIRKRVQWDQCVVMTRKVNLPCMCGQWSQQVICSQCIDWLQTDLDMAWNN